MTESLNVIALISGGKDSLYSILHCVQNGHKVVALSNLYPPASSPKSRPETSSQNDGRDEEAEQDLNSFMYQTVGHTVIPLYEQALGIPLYRQQIIGSAVHTGTSYSPSTGPLAPETASRDGEADETESLIPLLQTIKAAFPHANALSTGAILSTYQRTRVESVALRLGLTPLSFLWQYPTLPPGTQTSLLRDMLDVGLDARIVKVASGGLDESFLWENVASEAGIRRVEKSMKRFGVDGDGGVLGEGGEFETLAVDGPESLFKGRIQVQEEDRRIVREGGGSAWLRILDAKVVMKSSEEEATKVCRIPDILEQRFKDIMDSLSNDRNSEEIPNSTSEPPSAGFAELDVFDSESIDLSSLTASQNITICWTVTGNIEGIAHSIVDEAIGAIVKVRQVLDHLSLTPKSIVSTTIILRSMQDFASLNSVYGQLFTTPNPPSRVTISCGDLLPSNTNILIHLKISTSTLPSAHGKALHVQSRSYWAPANIGPYSQATSISIPSSNENEHNLSTVSIAGQIPLIPSSMNLPSPSASGSELADFKFQAVLSLQHLFRIGAAMSVSWLTGTVAYLSSYHGTSLPTSTRAILAGHAWKAVHAQPSVDDDDSHDGNGEPRDLWEEKHYAGIGSMGKTAAIKILPDWEAVEFGEGMDNEVQMPTFWAAEVEELPRGASIEWAALPGTVGGAVKVSCKTQEGCWKVEQSCFGNAIQTVVMVFHTENAAEVATRVLEALKAVGLKAATPSSSSWLDLSIADARSILVSKRLGGLVPCRSLWDDSGRRLAAILVLDTIATE